MPVSLWFSDANSVVRGHVFNFVLIHGELAILLVGVGCGCSRSRRGRCRGRRTRRGRCRGRRSRTVVEMAFPAADVHLATDLIGDPKPVLVHLVVLVDCQVVQLLVLWSLNARVLNI